jgi:hypothetical protein
MTAKSASPTATRLLVILAIRTSELLGRKPRLFTPTALQNTAQGRGSAPWDKYSPEFVYPERLAQTDVVLYTTLSG